MGEFEKVQGQINFFAKGAKGWNCIVIKDGEFHNMHEEHRQFLLKKLSKTVDTKTEEISLDDLF